MDQLLDAEHENERIVLGLLNSVEHDGDRSQRHIAAELGIALGLVNAYLKRCVKKGLVKVQDAPARRDASRAISAVPGSSPPWGARNPTVDASTCSSTTSGRASRSANPTLRR